MFVQKNSHNTRNEAAKTLKARFQHLIIVSDKGEKVLKTIALLIGIVSALARGVRPVSADHVFVVTILPDLDLLRLAAHRARIEMDQHHVFCALSLWHWALSFPELALCHSDGEARRHSPKGSLRRVFDP